MSINDGVLKSIFTDVEMWKLVQGILENIKKHIK